MWTYTISATLVGQGLDSLVFITVAFVGTIPAAGRATVVVAQRLVKTAYEILATPLAYAVVGFLKREEGSEVKG